VLASRAASSGSASLHFLKLEKLLVKESLTDLRKTYASQEGRDSKKTDHLGPALREDVKKKLLDGPDSRNEWWRPLYMRRY